jgi:peptide/nickel transport system permease protein
LSFLGLGVRPPAPSWGQMLNVGRIHLYRAPWYGLFPGIFLTLLVLTLNVLADTIQRLMSRGQIR